MSKSGQLIILGWIILGFCVSPTRAQVDETPVSSLEEIEKKYKKPDVTLLREFTAVVSKAEKNDRDLQHIDFAAKYFVCRVTWPEWTGNQDLLAKAIKEFDKEYSKQGPQNSPEFNQRVAFYLREILEKRDFKTNRLTSVNAAQLLAIAGKGKSPEISKLLVELIENPKQHDAIKLYAIRGLRHYFPVEVDGNPQQPRSYAAHIERIKPLTKFIEQKWPETTDPLEIEAYHYLRREAIHSLAKAGVPAVYYGKMAKIADANELHGQVAITLLRVLSDKDLEPTPKLIEKCYAAMGLCDMNLPAYKLIQPVLIKEYDPSLAVYAIGHTLREFVTAYQVDRLKHGGAFKPGAAAHPWKSLAEQWKKSLENLETNTKGTKSEANAKKLKDAAMEILTKIIGHNSVEVGELNALRGKVQEMRPAGKKVFNIEKVPEIDLGNLGN